MKKNNSTLILTGRDIETMISTVGIDVLMDLLIQSMYDEFLNFDDQDVMHQIRSGFNYNTPKIGLIEWMPLRTVSSREVFMKVVGYHPNNPTDFELPTILSCYSIFDSETGHLKSIMDGVLMTALRTGAASAVASKLFAKEDSKIIGMIGCGAQSVTQIHAISRVFDLDTVLYFDIDDKCMHDFEKRMSFLDFKFVPSSIEEIVSQSDIVCTATSIGQNEGPLFSNFETKEYLHINAVGSDFPGKIELPIQFLEQSYVSPDYKEQAIIEGECQQLSSDQIGDDIIHCIKNANNLKHLKNQLTVFDSTGIAIEDKVVSDLFLAYAKELNVGSSISFESINSNEKDPYGFLKSHVATLVDEMKR